MMNYYFPLRLVLFLIVMYYLAGFAGMWKLKAYILHVGGPFG